MSCVPEVFECQVGSKLSTLSAGNEAKYWREGHCHRFNWGDVEGVRDRRDMERARVGGQERNASGRAEHALKEQEGHSGSMIRSEHLLSPPSSAHDKSSRFRVEWALLTHN